MKKESITLVKNNGFDQIFEQYCNLGFSFYIGRGKYSHYVDFPAFKEKYVTTMQPKKVFIGYNMIRRDLKRPEVEFTLEDMFESVTEEANEYYSAGLLVNRSVKECLHIDINSAYLTALKNFGLITDQTYNYINTFPKKSRLVAVGMLAKKKEIIYFKEGLQASDPEYDISPYRFVFNAAVQAVNQVMHDLARHIPKRFLFYWVDGVYIDGWDNWEDLKGFIEDRGYRCKVEFLTRFYSENLGDHVKYKFRDEKNNHKVFCVPVDGVLKRQKEQILTNFKWSI